MSKKALITGITGQGWFKDLKIHCSRFERSSFQERRWASMFTQETVLPTKALRAQFVHYRVVQVVLSV